MNTELENLIFTFATQNNTELDPDDDDTEDDDELISLNDLANPRTPPSLKGSQRRSSLNPTSEPASPSEAVAESISLQEYTQELISPREVANDPTQFIIELKKIKTVIDEIKEQEYLSPRVRILSNTLAILKNTSLILEYLKPLGSSYRDELALCKSLIEANTEKINLCHDTLFMILEKVNKMEKHLKP